MDLIRYSTIENKAIQDAAASIVSIDRKLAAYLRDDNKAAELIVIITANKSKQGRLFGKNRDLAVIGSSGNKNNKWSHPECIVLKVSLLFIVQFGGALRFDSNASPASQSNVNVIHRVYNALILKEDLDIAYSTDFRERKNKAIKDKLILCSKLKASEPNGVLLEIKTILVKHLKINQFRKEPSSGLLFFVLSIYIFVISYSFFCDTKKIMYFHLGQEALQQAQIKELKERNKTMHRKLKESKSEKMDKVLDLLAMNLQNPGVYHKQSNQNAAEEAADANLELALKNLGDDSSDMEILPPNIEENNKSTEEKKESFEYSVNHQRSGSNAASPAVFANHDSRRKIHGFIDELTSNDVIMDEDKQEICLAFYDHSLSDDVAAYLDSLLSTRKSLTEIATNLLWFINCLKKREDKL